MIDDLPFAAFLCAATEVLPAEWRDLSDILTHWADVTSPRGSKDSRAANLYTYLIASVSNERVSHWQEILAHLDETRPDIEFTSVRDLRYPGQLRNIYDRPPFIFYRGRLPGRRTISIVGSRTINASANKSAYEIAAGLAQRGYWIVSGLASGVDTAAHNGALDANGNTVAVIGHGIDHVTYPRSNHDLAERLVMAGGGILSQFRPGSPPTSSSFVVRNALISGLSPLSVIVRLAEKSGTRSEVDAALRQGRTVAFYDRHCDLNWVSELVRLNSNAHFFSSMDDLLEILKAVEGAST